MSLQSLSDAQRFLYRHQHLMKDAKLIELQRIWKRLDKVWKDKIPELETKPLPECNNGAWFCPVVTPLDALMILNIAIKNDVKVIYDMGAGDCRLSYWLALHEFIVTAYETLPEMPEWAEKVLGRRNFDLKARDYKKDFRRLVEKEPGALFVFIGGLNKPPFIPTKGMVIEGYYEHGVRYWKDSDLESQW